MPEDGAGDGGDQALEEGGEDEEREMGIVRMPDRSCDVRCGRRRSAGLSGVGSCSAKKNGNASHAVWRSSGIAAYDLQALHLWGWGEGGTMWDAAPW